MAITAAVTGYATTFGKNGGTAIPELNKISGTGINRETVEATNLSSPSEWKEFVFGLLEGTDISIEFNYLPTNATQKLIHSDMIAGTSATYDITLPNGTSIWSAVMLPSSFQVGDLEAGTKMTASATFKQTGVVTPPSA
jgi:hypothetical protein